MPYKEISLLTITLILYSFKIVNTTDNFNDQLIRLKQTALKTGMIGYDYIYDLTGIKDCNKTHIKYLGTVTTSKGDRYKILTVFAVYPTGKDMCKGGSSIEIYYTNNKYIGEYNVGTPEDLPDKLEGNRLIYLTNSKECSLKKKNSINLGNGLPKSFFIKCSEQGGDIYRFSSGN